MQAAAHHADLPCQPTSHPQQPSVPSHQATIHPQLPSVPSHQATIHPQLPSVPSHQATIHPQQPSVPTNQLTWVQWQSSVSSAARGSSHQQQEQQQQQQQQQPQLSTSEAATGSRHRQQQGPAADIGPLQELPCGQQQQAQAQHQACEAPPGSCTAAVLPAGPPSSTAQQAGPHVAPADDTPPASAAQQAGPHLAPPPPAGPSASAAQQAGLQPAPPLPAAPPGSSAQQAGPHAAPLPPPALPPRHERDLSYWDFGAAVFETFPWQKEAFEYADFCNLLGPAAVKQLQATTRTTNFTNFAARWQHLRGQMQAMVDAQKGGSGGQQQQQEQEQQQTGHLGGAVLGTAADHQQQQQQQQAAQAPRAGSTSMSGQPQQGQQQQQLLGHQAKELLCTSCPEGVAGAAAAPAQQDGQPQPQQPQQERQRAAAEEEVVRVFCQEYRGRHGSYSRHFVATTYHVLWRKYRNLPADQRHYYEVIRGGRPCHLYFDLEYPRGANPGADGDALVDLLVDLLREYLLQQWELQLQPEWVLELDSTTPVKFSRHLLLRIPGCAFPNNLVVGQVVAQLKAHHRAQQLLLPREDGSGKASIIDSAVYSKSRHFRMYMSCKGGKAAVLTETPRYLTRGPPLPRPQLFLQSLICNVTPNSRLLTPSWAPPSYLALSNAPASGSSSSSSGVAGAPPPAISGMADVHHPSCSGGYGDPRPIKMTWVYTPRSPAEVACAGQLQATAIQAVLWVEAVAAERAGGLAAQVRSMAYCGEGGTVAYGLIGPGSHYCSHVQRCHKSNHTFLVLDFATALFCQKCYDPDCSGYRSPWAPIPPSVCNREALLPLLAPTLFNQHSLQPVPGQQPPLPGQPQHAAPLQLARLT